MTIVRGKSRDELKTRTLKVLDKIRESDIKLIKNKCIFEAIELTFLGHKLSKLGVSADPPPQKKK